MPAIHVATRAWGTVEGGGRARGREDGGAKEGPTDGGSEAGHEVQTQSALYFQASKGRRGLTLNQSRKEKGGVICACTYHTLTHSHISTR